MVVGVGSFGLSTPIRLASPLRFAGRASVALVRRRALRLMPFRLVCAAMENLIDGKAVAAQVRAEVGERVRALQERTGVQCGLATVMVGDDPASAVYVGNKHRACHEAGHGQLRHPSARATSIRTGLHAKIDEVCTDPRIHGMIVQLPLPPHLDEDAALDRIVYTKDADGLTPAAQGRLATLRPGPRPATPNGVVELLRRYQVELSGAHAVIVGRSEIVGKPQAHLLLEQNCTVTICHSRTRDLPAITRQADILVAAVGPAGDADRRARAATARS